MTTQAKPEIIYGMSFGDYCDIAAVNATKLLTYFECSPEEAYFKQTHDDKDSESLRRGHAGHAAILEPDTFERDFARMPRLGDSRTKAAKEAKAEFEEAHKDSIILTDGEYIAATSMRDSVLKDSFISEFFTGKGTNEVTVLWTDDETDLPCKARIDRLTFFHGYQVLLDIKTARDVNDYWIQKAIADYRYHIRMAWYMDALNRIKLADWRVCLVWVLNRAPWTARVTEFEEDDLLEGRLQYRSLLNTHAHCLERGYWPGYAQGIEPLGLPRNRFKLHQPKGL